MLISNVTKTMRNTTAAHSESINISPWLIVVGLLICAWTILANACVFLCLISNQKTKKIATYIPLLGLSFTDMLVGLCMIPMVLTQSTSLYLKPEACAGVLFIYFVCQGATLYHTFLVCFHRLLILCRKKTKRENFNASLVQISLTWIGCFIFFGIPFPIFTEISDERVYCSLPALFGANYIFATGLWGALIILPFSCVNLMYVYLFVHLKAKWRTINAAVAHSTHNPSHQRLDYIEDTDNENVKSQMTPEMKMLETISNEQAVLKPADIPGQDVQPSTSKSLSERTCPTVIHVKPAIIHHMISNTIETEKDVREEEGYPSRKINIRRKGINNATAHTTDIGIKTQRRVLITVGVILMTFDLCMTPLVFFALFETVYAGYVSRSIKLVCLILAMLNSSLNPVINVSMIKPFREILIEIGKKVFCCSRR